MATRPHNIYNNQQGSSYIHKRGIHELFEAIMTALMVHKPDDHIAFIRECLDKVQNNPNRIRWDHFVTNSSNAKGAAPSRLSITKNRQKPLPPVRSSIPTTRISYSSTRQMPLKGVALPPIDNSKKFVLNVPVVFILSACGSTKLCSKLMEQYDGITYLSINDIANIDENHFLDLKKHQNRYEAVQHAIEKRHSNSNGFIIAGHLDERNFCGKWHEKLGRLDLIILLSSDQQTMSNQNLDFIQIDPSNDFDIIFGGAIRALDQLFTHQIYPSESSQTSESTIHHFSLPIILCIDSHRLLVRNPNSNNGEHELAHRISIDDELCISDEESEVESNNSFIYTLCERLAEQLSFKHLHFGNSNNDLASFDQLKEKIIESMSTCTGYIIEHFPTSFQELQKFQNEVGNCSALIYIGEYPTEIKQGDFNIIVEKFQRENRAIHIDCRMEVDEIYEDLHKDILKLI